MGCSSSGNVIAVSRVILCTALAAILTCGLAFAALNEESIKKNQATRDALFKRLKGAHTEYRFEYVVIHLPPGVIPGIDFSLPVSHIRYSRTVFFAFDSYQLEATAERPLADLAEALAKDRSSRSVLIVGHTDSIGSVDYNRGLSLNRAVTVADRLRALGIKASVLGVVPMGESQPAASNGELAGRAINRRVEFFISEVPEATARAIELIRFNPCHLDDHDKASSASRLDCMPDELRVPVLGPTGRGEPRELLDLTRSKLPEATGGPLVRLPLPDEMLLRRSLRELEDR